MKNCYSLILAALVLLTFIRSSEATLPRPDTDIFSIEYRATPGTGLENPQSTGLDESTEIQTSVVRLATGFKPIKGHGGTWVLGCGLSYENVHFDYQNWNSETNPSRVDTLHGIGAIFFYRKQMQAKGWSLRSFLAPGLASDFYQVTLKSLRLQGGLIFTQENETRRLGVGLVALDDFGTPRLFPAISYEQVFRQHHRILLRAPTVCSYTYQNSRRWEAGAALRVNGINARIEEDGAFHGKNASYSMGTVGPNFRYWITPKISWLIESAWVFRHQFEILDRKTEVKNYDLNRTWMLATGLKVGF